MAAIATDYLERLNIKIKQRIQNTAEDTTQKTSSAGSATLGDTRLARLTIQLGASKTQKKPIRGLNLPDFQLRLESKTQLSLAKAQNYMEFEN